MNPAEQMAGLLGPEKAPSPIKFGDVTAVSGNNLTVQMTPGGGGITAVRCCAASVGDRVAILAYGTQWVAVGVVGDVGARAPTGVIDSYLWATPAGEIMRATTAGNRLFGTDNAGKATDYSASSARGLLGLSRQQQNIEIAFGLTASIISTALVTSINVQGTASGNISAGHTVWTFGDASARPVVTTILFDYGYIDPRFRLWSNGDLVAINAIAAGTYVAISGVFMRQ
jgi:hypothetical protein